MKNNRSWSTPHLQVHALTSVKHNHPSMHEGRSEGRFFPMKLRKKGPLFDNFFVGKKLPWICGKKKKHHIEQKKTVETPCCQKFQFVLPDFTKETKKKQACLPITDLSNRPTIIKIAPPFTYLWFNFFIFRIDGENFVFCDPKFKYGENHPDLFVNLPPKFNSSPLKNGGWKMPIYFRKGLISCQLC